MSLPSRIRIARYRRGWSVVELADRSRVSARSLGDYERGVSEPELTTLEDIAAAVEFPIDFFSGPEIDEVPAESVSFRALSRLSARQRNAALASAALATELSTWLSRRYELPTAALEDYAGMDPETCATVVRRLLGVGERPLRNVVHVLERQGVRVFSLAEDCRELDAISFWTGSVPLVMLNSQKSFERSRFDAAHELGHLLLHQHAHGTCSDVDPDDEANAKPARATENEANAFASAFLMPRAALLTSVPRAPRLDELIQIKREWKVSLASLVYRLRTIEAISESQYRYLCLDMSRRGYRTMEPHPIEDRETSQVLAKALGELRHEGIGRGDVARRLRWPRRELEGLVFGVTLQGTGGVPDSESSPRAQLHIVK